jgi:hypothetical protein
MVVIGDTWEEPVDAAVLQEVAGLVALLLVLLCADGGRCGGPATGERLAKRERLANDVDCAAANERPMIWVCLIIGWGLLGRVLLG